MKLLLDQNISFRLIKLLSGHFVFVTHVNQENLINVSDLEIRNHAIRNGYTIVTYDDDFIKYNHLHGQPPKIIWIRRGNLSNEALAQLLIKAKERIELFVSSDLQIGILEII
jgi:predicted nuclease of predicted toxin-antitoxin system